MKLLIKIGQKKMLFDKQSTINELIENAELVTGYNNNKIEYLRNYLTERQREAFDLIPFLLHEERPGVDKGDLGGCALTGVSCFTYTSELKQLIQKYFPRFIIPREQKKRFPIKFLALMGSAGTVAFTKESDMDFWVGLESSQNEEDVYALKERFYHIETWAYDVAGLEVHFFIIDLHTIREDNFGSIDEQSCGSSLGKLLKEEFYRTAIFVSGNLPYYWIMPPGIDDPQYEHNIALLVKNLTPDQPQFLDLGNVYTIDQGEYVGAALWQLFKGLHNPFKSVLKMALIDRYSSANKRAVPLCEFYKKEVLNAQQSDMADSYLFLVEALRTYYNHGKMQSVRTLIEECFLIRNLLSMETAEQEDKARTQLFYYLGKRWGWAQEQIDDLAQFKEWNFAKRDILKKRVLEFLITTYTRIRSRTKDRTTLISDRDLTVIGKKLKCILELKANKIPYEYSLFMARDVALIKIDTEDARKKGKTWQIALWIKGAKSAHPQILRRVPDPISACVWCSLNNFYSGKERVEIADEFPLSENELLLLIKECNRFFSPMESNSLDIEEILEEEYVTHLYIMPNWQAPQWTRGIGSLSLVYRNNLGEMFYRVYKGTQWQGWLQKEILEETVGLDHLNRLVWDVHVFRGNMSSTRRISSIISTFVTEAIEKGIIKRKLAR